MNNNIVLLKCNQDKTEEENINFPFVMMSSKKRQQREIAFKNSCRERLKEKQNFKWIWHNIRRITNEHSR